MPNTTAQATPEAPEAAYPAPPFAFYVYVVENDAAAAYDGGKVMFSAVRGRHETAMTDARIVIASRTDDLLMRWPWKTRAAKEARFFRVTVEEVTADELPPDPEHEREIAAAERRLAELKARAGA